MFQFREYVVRMGLVARAASTARNQEMNFQLYGK